MPLRVEHGRADDPPRGREQHHSVSDFHAYTYLELSTSKVGLGPGIVLWVVQRIEGMLRPEYETGGEPSQRAMSTGRSASIPTM